MLNCFANKVYEWVSRSMNQRNKLKRLLMNVFEAKFIVILQICVVQFYIFLNLEMELYLVVQAKLWENYWENLQKIFN